MTTVRFFPKRENTQKHVKTAKKTAKYSKNVEKSTKSEKCDIRFFFEGIFFFLQRVQKHVFMMCKACFEVPCLIYVRFRVAVGVLLFHVFNVFS